MAARAISGSSGEVSGVLMRDQMPAIGQRSSPVSTNVQIISDVRRVAELLGCCLRRMAENKLIMGSSSLRSGHGMSVLVVYPGRV